MARLILISCATVLTSLLVLRTVLAKESVVYSWKSVNYKYPSEAIEEEWKEKLIKQNNVIIGVKISGKSVYLTIPRWREGVPATLTKVPFPESEDGNGPVLEPYPSWEMNMRGNCSALQFIMSMEIDQFGRMWALDVGRVNFAEETPDNTCPPKLVLIDTTSERPEVLLTYVFPPEVVSRDSSFLNDIAVGCESQEDCWAFISDAKDAKIVFYNLEQNKAWFAKHSSMLADPKFENVTVGGKVFHFKSTVNGLALSPKDKGFDRLYFSPLSSTNIYSLETSALRKLSESDGPGGDLQDSDVTNHGSKKSQSGGMVMDAEGRIYYGLMNDNSVYFWNSSEGSLSENNQILVFKDDERAQWPDTFAIDEDGNGYVTTNRLHLWKNKEYDLQDVNFRLIKFPVGVKSYMYSASSEMEDVDEFEDEAATGGTTMEAVTSDSFFDQATESATEGETESSTGADMFSSAVDQVVEIKQIKHNHREGKKFAGTDATPDKKKNKDKEIDGTVYEHVHQDHEQHDQPDHHDHGHEHSHHEHVHEHPKVAPKLSKPKNVTTQSKSVSFQPSQYQLSATILAFSGMFAVMVPKLM